MRFIIPTGLFVAALFGGVFSLVPTPAAAHFSGNSWEYRSGPYIMDIGYDTDVFTADSYVRFDFSLKDEASLDPREFTSVWVRVISGEEQKRTLLATGIHSQEVGPTTLLFVFPDAGSYTLEASFRDASGRDLATTSFPIVAKSAESIDMPLVVAGVGGVALGAFGFFAVTVLYKRRRA